MTTPRDIWNRLLRRYEPQVETCPPGTGPFTETEIATALTAAVDDLACRGEQALADADHFGIKLRLRGIEFLTREDRRTLRSRVADRRAALFPHEHEAILACSSGLI